MNWLCRSGGQNIGASASASVLSMSIQGCFPLGLTSLQSSSVQFSPSVVSDSLWPHGLQHARSTCPLPTPGACSNPCPLSRWCHWVGESITGITLQFTGLSKTCSISTVWKHQFFSTQSSLWSNSHIHIWHWKNHRFDSTDVCWQSDVSAF